jgi:DNA processing protein
VLEELLPGALSSTARTAVPDDTDMDDTGDSLLQALGFSPVGLDALLARTGLDTPTLQARLMALEIEGQLTRLPGGLFQRMARS